MASKFLRFNLSKAGVKISPVWAAKPINFWDGFFNLAKFATISGTDSNFKLEGRNFLGSFLS